MTKPLTILVVDDVDLNRRMLDSFIRKLGHLPVLVENGLEAVEYCADTPPDMILMDIMMPVMDGFTATERIRAQLGEHWIPIIFLSAMTEQADYLHGLAVGGDDYLTKPVNLLLLSAKISVMLRIIEMQSHLSDSHLRLEQYYATNQQEQSLAQHVLERFNTAANVQQHNIKTWLKSAVHLSGDVICVARSPSGADHILLADSTGHGLVAAICCLPAIDTFHAMTQRGFAINTIAESINHKLYHTLPTGHFVAATLIAVHYEERMIAVWNGGIPCCSFLNARGVIEKHFRSCHPPLGTMSPDGFDDELEQYRWQLDGELIVCSDGMTEARNEQQQQFGQDGVLQAARQARGQHTAQQIADAVQRHLGEQQYHDDASLVVIGCDSTQERSLPCTPGTPASAALNRWQIRLAFDAAQLKEQDCLSIVIDWLNRLQLPPAHFSAVLLIVSQLFKHALDHLLLGLNWHAGLSAARLDDYFAQRRLRLQQLQQADLAISIARDDETMLNIRLYCASSDRAPRHDSDALLDSLQHKLGHAVSLQQQAEEISVQYRLD